ncbi:DUF1266 domain-containing protein [Chitinophaga barathri]|nr:DUF1266 domain-containing protein [Chitinophaga barathri]
MSTFIQNHPGEQDAKPKGNPNHNNQGLLYVTLLLLCIPLGITIPVLKRLTTIGKIENWTMYGIIAVLSLLTIAMIILVTKRMMFKNTAEQKKYYRLAGGLTWLPQEKREALQLEAPSCYHTGSWVETLEYWPAEIRMPRKTRFTTFQIVTKEDRLAANDEAWKVLSEKTYNERIDQLFAGMHSRLFASDKQLMTDQTRNAMISRLEELTQLPERYITSCWEPQGSNPAILVWAFDLQRIIELSRTSFMAGLITEQKAWEQILKAADYIHALFDEPDAFFNNYRIGHAYWSNDFKQTNEMAQIQKAYNNNCKWSIKDVSWTRKDHNILPDVILNGCKDYVEEEIKKNAPNSIGFQPGNNDNN